MDGDSLPVSAFVDHVDGQFELGASAYEKRGIAVSFPAWNSTKCIQCNQCAYVCPHATIRPFCLTADEAAAAPEAPSWTSPGPRQGRVQVHHGRVSSGLHGLRRVRQRLPPTALRWCRRRGRATSRMCSTTASRTSDKKDIGRPPSRAASSSSPAGVLRRLRRLRRDPYARWSPSCSATTCSSPTPPAAPPSGAVPLPSPYCTNKEGHGPAWATPCSRTTPSTV